MFWFTERLKFYYFHLKANQDTMSAYKITTMARNVARLSVFQPRNLNLIRQFATKIEPKKTSSLKLLLIGVSILISFAIVDLIEVFLPGWCWSSSRRWIFSLRWDRQEEDITRGAQNGNPG